jgi:AhpD family alkylhydroperoxidase
MTDNARVPATPMTGLYAGVLKIAMRRMLGKVPESAGVLWNHPKVFLDMARFGGKVERWDRLDPVLATYASMTAAATIGCSACLDLHYFLTHEKGLDEAKAQQVPRWRESTVFTPQERRVMEYAEAICTTPVSVTDEMSAALLDDLGAAALLELTARVGMMNMAARSNIALGLRSEHYADACGLPPIAERPADVASPA